MDVAGSAVGIVSLGIQVCQGLLSYYDSWKNYELDTVNARESIDDLSRTLSLLKGSLNAENLKAERTDRVRRCLEACVDGINKLSSKLQKLRNGRY